MDDKDPPIQETAFVAGVKVVQIEDLRIARGLSRRPYSSCPHVNLIYDNSERRIWCSDCETNIEPFDAFRMLAERAHSHNAKLEKRAKEIAEAEKFQIRSLAARAIDQVWRKRSKVPACPHCGHGLLPEHFKNGVKVVLGREYAVAKLKKK